MSPAVVRLFHFNDVYNVEGFEREPVGGAARFRTAMKQTEPDIVVFSGDAFAPSIMSTVLRGGQMPSVLNALDVDVAMLGNHDFDFGVERCKELVEKTKFPWLLSNAKMEGISPPEYVVRKVCGITFGFIGLIEYEWLSTLASLTEDQVQYEDFTECAERLSKELRNVHKCDAVIALTHMRQPNDARLARETDCLDLILGGHDHHYEVFRESGTLVCKSGTDFKQATLIEFSLAEIKHSKVVVDSSYGRDPKMKNVINSFSAAVDQSLDEECGKIDVPLDARFQAIRTSETNCGNLVADVVRDGCSADVALLNSGTLRSDTVHSAGSFTKKHLLQLLPMDDQLCTLQLNGAQLAKAIENSVSQWPRLEGRFLQVSGVSFVFDASKPPMNRVTELKVAQSDVTPEQLYVVAIKQYMHSGKDGFDMLPECPVVTDSEHLPSVQTMLTNRFHAFNSLRPIRDGRITLRGAKPVVEPIDY